MKSEPCAICGGTDTNLVDGYYYCVECGTQDMTIMETVVESGVLQDGTFAVAAKRKINKKKVSFQMSGEWYKWHAYNFILSGIADELISLGASPSFKTKLLWIWFLYIKKFHCKEDYDKNNLTQQNSVLESCQKDSDIEEDDLNDNENDEDALNDDERSNRKTKKQIGLSTMTFTILYAMVYCALNLDKSDIQASDVVRFIREGRLSKKSAAKYVPKELNLSTIPQWHSFIKSYVITFNVLTLLQWSCTLFKELDLGTPLIPNLGNLVTRYCKELCLPKEFRQLVMSLLELIPPESCCKELWHNSRQLPEFEGTVMAYIVIGLKMCFGLDDDYDQRLTYTVNEMNDEENHLKAYRIGIYEPTDRLFSFGEWLKYLEFRKLLLCKYYQPMSIIHQTEINSCLITESLKDLMKYDKRGRRDEMTVEFLNKIPQDNDFNILPKEGFPASLTPLTVYTEHVLLNAKVEDSRIKLLLSEDFSKYNLNYACVDLKLQFSSASENLIQGVEEINEDDAHFVKNPLNASHVPKDPLDTRLSFVIDAENNNVLGNHAVVESACGDHVEIEMINEETKDTDLPKVSEVEEINTIAELDKDDNIFGVNFDTTDCYSQDHLQVNDFHCDERDDTVFDLLNYSEYDPQNFNREDVIRNLILRECSKYKIPKPVEYKDLPITPKITNKDDNKSNEDKPRKPREVYTGEFNSNNILDMYKKALDKMAQDVVTASHDIGELDDSNDGNLNNDTNSDLQPSLELFIERTEDFPNTDGMELAPTVVTSAPMDITDVLFNVNEAGESFAAATFDVGDEMEVDTEQNQEQGLEVLQNLDINDIVLAEIKKYEEEAKMENKREPEFNKNDDIPISKLFRKEKLKLRDRSHMTPLLNNPEGPKKFNYYILRQLKILILNVPLRTYSFEKEMLDNFPRSFRYVLQTCACIVEVHSYQLFRILQILEENLINTDLWTDIS